MNQQISEYLSKFDLDVRKSRDARFMDQKVTPDVLSIMADCVLNYLANRELEFTKDEVWNDQYFNKNVKKIFNKPDAKNKTTRQEYDKFTSQPLRMLAYAGVLFIRKEKSKNIYRVRNGELLEFIGLRERNAYIFLYQYLKKVLMDSNMFKYFDDFIIKCQYGNVDESDYEYLKNNFQRFIIGNTAINGITEVNRIFPKILNIISCENNTRGTIKGKLSSRQIYYTDLMYNRPNWRDGNKIKSVSRTESTAEDESLMIGSNQAYSDYIIQKTQNTIRKMYSRSEINDQWANGEATQVHHIFSRSEFPQLAHYAENLIKLTPTQHFTKAHPNNKTQQINKDYQLVCLLAKSDNIEKSQNKGEFFYRKESFIFVINTGLNQNLPYDIDFKTIKAELSKIYNSN